MYIDLNMKTSEVDEYTELLWNGDYPILTIDRDSYIVKARVETGLNYRLQDNCYSLKIGKYNSVAEDVLFMIDINHDHKGVCQGAPRELDFFGKPFQLDRKGEILILNDTWIGSGVTVMDGVTIHNGAVVAAQSVVTKDVPPYAIVAGNPARIVKYRFDEDVIEGLLSIQWWDWSTEELSSRKDDLLLPVREFVEKYRTDCEKRPIEESLDMYVFQVDMSSDYAFTARVIDEFCHSFSDGSYELVLFFDDENRMFEDGVIDFLSDYSETDAKVRIVDEGSIDGWIAKSKGYITGRGESVVKNASLAEKYGKSIIHGCSIPIWKK